MCTLVRCAARSSYSHDPVGRPSLVCVHLPIIVGALFTLGVTVTALTTSTQVWHVSDYARDPTNLRRFGVSCMRSGFPEVGVSLRFCGVSSRLCFTHVCATIGPAMGERRFIVGHSRSAWRSTASSTLHVVRVACRLHVVLGVCRSTAKLNHLESQSESRPRNDRVGCYCDSVRSDSILSDLCSHCLR